MNDNRHDNYEILNLIGYGLAKFDMEFVEQFGFQTKSEFYQVMVNRGVGESVGTIKNRQDLFDPFFPNKRKGWWQKGDAYVHRKEFIDSLFGEFGVNNFADIVKLYLKNEFKIDEFKADEASPIIKSKFKQLQLTGREAESYFKRNFDQINQFDGGLLEDARLLGDGYDFQIQIEANYFLIEVKGVRKIRGAFRMTEKEYFCANEYKSNFGLVIVSNLEDLPKMTAIFNPVEALVLERHESTIQQVSFQSKSMLW